MKPPYGAFAEKVVAGYSIPIPEGIDPAEAAAIPPSVLTSLLPLKYSAKLQAGETVLVNGATGVSGRIAFQVAKMLGAGCVIGTGRNPESLELLGALGADEVIDLRQSDENLKKAFQQLTIDVVVDFLWGHPAEILISTFIPQEVGFAKRNIRYIEIGGMAGSDIKLPASALRTSGLQMMGVGTISWDILTKEIEGVWEGIRQQKFHMDILRVPLSEIAWAWEQNELAGKRIVIIP
jgi:NADPH2:quinone reductase